MSWCCGGSCRASAAFSPGPLANRRPPPAPWAPGSLSFPTFVVGRIRSLLLVTFRLLGRGRAAPSLRAAVALPRLDCRCTPGKCRASIRAGPSFASARPFAVGRYPTARLRRAGFVAGFLCTSFLSGFIAGYPRSLGSLWRSKPASPVFKVLVGLALLFYSGWGSFV